MDNFNDPRMTVVRDTLLEVLADKLTELGGEYDLTYNEYGFRTAWLENDREVWWDKTADAMNMDEVTELAALYDTIIKTEQEISEQE